MWIKTGDGGMFIGGYVPRDAEYRTTQTGKALCKFSVKIAEKIVDGKREAIWQSCTCWNDKAEIAAELQKGDFVIAFGRVETNTFIGREGGEVTSKQLVCDYIQRMPRSSELAAPGIAYGGDDQLDSNDLPYGGDDQLDINDLPFG